MYVFLSLIISTQLMNVYMCAHTRATFHTSNLSQVAPLSNCTSHRNLSQVAPLSTRHTFTKWFCPPFFPPPSLFLSSQNAVWRNFDQRIQHRSSNHWCWHHRLRSCRGRLLLLLSMLLLGTKLSSAQTLGRKLILRIYMLYRDMYSVSRSAMHTQ